ncbi:hypothetical protein E5K00_03595 [Hymenobacter aquaticus]|uniref:Uncharacterized protein n=1 Tax=Hymenobacter aquaticus TaxID=1867101 RepID=A0A4Z0Q5G5_9BACT|nr:RICIN domain-containing protein [Hymenobacter aquaticus]TGE24311.1 hypothetical protein E5K00_03595 [Hymenobacter aquaticus]
MAFRPARDTQYFLLAKNSNMPLGVQGNSGDVGAEMVQQTWSPDSAQPQQHFRLDGAPNYTFYIKPGHRDLYLEPKASRDGRGREDGTPIVQAIWNAGAGHQRFQLIPAGDDDYRIRCLHSGKFWDVYGNTTAVGARLVQHGLTPTDNQLFRLVAVPRTGLSVNTTSFRGYTNYGRMLVLGLAGVIPKVGGGVSALIGLIWPSDHDQRFWQQMKDYVDVRMTEMLQHVRLLQLESYLVGLIKNLRLANDPDLPPTDRWNHLVAVTAGATAIEQAFLTLDYQDSHRILSHLGAWGTLVLGANAQMMRDYAEMHPDKTAAEHAKGKAVYKKVLQANIAQYSKALMAARANALQWRLERIGTVMTMVVDERGGWMRILSDFTAEGIARANQAAAARRDQVRAQFEAEMDALLAPVRLWRFLNPDVTERPAQDIDQRVVGPFPLRQNETPFELVTGTITSLSMGQIGDIVSGLVVHYADGRKRASGNETHNMKTLTLAPGEYITSAYGLERGPYIVGLTFETNLGQLFTTGEPSTSDHTYDFMASVDDALSPRLTGLSYGGGGLCFHWEYSWTYDWTGAIPAGSQLAEPTRPALVLQAPAAEPAQEEVVQDFTTREFAAGQW